MKKLTAILLVLALVLGSVIMLTACGKEEKADETTTAAETTEDAFANFGEDETSAAADETAAAADETAAGDTTAAAETEAGETTAAAETKPGETTAAAAETKAEEKTTKAAPKAPATKEEIIAYFNKSVNMVKSDAKSAVHHYSKITLAGNTTLPGALDGILKILGGADKFLGDQLAKNSKGEEKMSDLKGFPVENETWASKLTAADVKEAQIKEANGQYMIKIVTVADEKTANVKHGQGHAPKAFNAVLPGIVNDNIPGVATGIVGTATMNYPSSTAIITVDVATGRVLKADYTLYWTINFDKAGAILPFCTSDSYTINW